MAEASHPDPPAAPASRRAAARLAGSADLLAAGALASVAALATQLPGGDPARLALGAAAVVAVPGYLLLQALLVPAAPWRTRGLHLLMGLGVSVALVGLLAAGVGLLPGWFRPDTLVGAVTLACLALAGVAFVRRGAPARTAAA